MATKFLLNSLHWDEGAMQIHRTLFVVGLPLFRLVVDDFPLRTSEILA